MKWLLILSLLLFTSCIQLQVPVASTVINVTVIKTQALTEDSNLSGADIKELMKDLNQEAGDITPPLIP
jgi:hypothetical protein